MILPNSIELYFRFLLIFRRQSGTDITFQQTFSESNPKRGMFARAETFLSYLVSPVIASPIASDALHLFFRSRLNVFRGVI